MLRLCNLLSLRLPLLDMGSNVIKGKKLLTISSRINQISPHGLDWEGTKIQKFPTLIISSYQPKWQNTPFTKTFQQNASNYLGICSCFETRFLEN